MAMGKTQTKAAAQACGNNHGFADRSESPLLFERGPQVLNNRAADHVRVGQVVGIHTGNASARRFAARRTVLNVA